MIEILEGIAQVLFGLFPDITCYISPVEQDIQLPCFIVSPIGSNSKRRIGGDRHMIEDSFQIAILSDDYEQIYETADIITYSLDRIPLSDGDILTYNLEKNPVLDGSCTINFDVHRTMLKQSEKPQRMENLQFHLDYLDE